MAGWRILLQPNLWRKPGSIQKQNPIHLCHRCQIRLLPIVVCITLQYVWLGFVLPDNEPFVFIFQIYIGPGLCCSIYYIFGFIGPQIEGWSMACHFAWPENSPLFGYIYWSNTAISTARKIYHVFICFGRQDTGSILMSFWCHLFALIESWSHHQSIYKMNRWLPHTKYFHPKGLMAMAEISPPLTEKSKANLLPRCHCYNALMIWLPLLLGSVLPPAININNVLRLMRIHSNGVSIQTLFSNWSHNLHWGCLAQWIDM